MYPVPGDVHVNRLLSNMLHAYTSEPGDFVADIAAPNVPVSQRSNNYSVYQKDDWFRVEITKPRGLSSEADSGGWTIDNTNTYVANVFAFKHPIDDQIRANEEAPINVEDGATRYVSEQLRLKKESDWMATFFVTSTWTGGSGGVDITGVSGTPSTNQVKQWNDAASTPIEDVDAQAVAIKKKTGKYPNTLIVGAEVWYTGLKNHPDVLDRIKYTQKGIVSLDLVASLMNLDRVLVASSIKNTAARGATASMSFLAGKAALLAYVNPNPQIIGTPTSMVTFSWTGYTGASNLGTRMKKYREEKLNSDIFEGEMAFAMKLVGPDLGVFFTSLVV